MILEILLVAFVVYELVGIGFVVYSLGLNDQGYEWRWRHFVGQFKQDRRELLFWFKISQTIPPLTILFLCMHPVAKLVEIDQSREI